MAASDWEPTVVAIITGFAGIVSAAGGVLLVIRSVRNKERKAAKHEYAEVSAELHAEREARVALEEVAYEQRRLLAQNGIAPPGEIPQVKQVADEPEPDPPGPRRLSSRRDRVQRCRADDGDSGGGDEPGSDVSGQ